MTTAPPWRVVLVTETALAARWMEGRLARHGHRVVGILTSSKRDAHYLDVVSGASPGTDVIVSSYPKRWARMLAPMRPDLIVSCFFPWRIPIDVIELPRLGTVNIHPSLLPAYRGTVTPLWMLRNGERTFGISMHRMTADFDTGAILAQARFEADDDDVFATLVPKLMHAGDALWDPGLARIAAGDPGEPQNERLASYYGRIEDWDSWRQVDWALPARDVHNIVRSCSSPFQTAHGALAVLENVTITILRTTLVEHAAPQRHATPGTILSRDGAGLLVQCGDGPLRIVACEPHEVVNA